MLNVRKNLKNKKNIVWVLICVGVFWGLFTFHERASQIYEVVVNRGISFGLDLGVWQGIVGIFLGIVLLIKWHKYWGARLMIIGAMGNFIDRLRWGGVRDYWNFFEIWINNIYDWVIVLGGILLIIELWRKSSK